MFRFLLIFAVLFAASAPSPAHAGRDLLIVTVGGNSECSGLSGIKKLLALRPVLRTTLQAYGRDRVVAKHFSWTGDPTDQRGCLPGNANWITGGSSLIQEQTPDLGRRGADTPLVIIGWSNGGATAYELACDLAKQKAGSVSLLITLDPASWTTRACMVDGKPVAPAKQWIGVYTKSQGLSRFAGSNLIAFFGSAWNDEFPQAPAVRPTSLFKLQPADHGDVVEMWDKCVNTGAGLGGAAHIKRPWPRLGEHCTAR